MLTAEMNVFAWVVSGWRDREAARRLDADLYEAVLFTDGGEFVRFLDLGTPQDVGRAELLLVIRKGALEVSYLNRNATMRLSRVESFLYRGRLFYLRNVERMVDGDGRLITTGVAFRFNFVTGNRRFAEEVFELAYRGEGKRLTVVGKMEKVFGSLRLPIDRGIVPLIGEEGCEWVKSNSGSEVLKARVEALLAGFLQKRSINLQSVRFDYARHWIRRRLVKYAWKFGYMELLDLSNARKEFFRRLGASEGVLITEEGKLLVEQSMREYELTDDSASGTVLQRSDDR